MKRLIILITCVLFAGCGVESYENDAPAAPPKASLPQKIERACPQVHSVTAINGRSGYPSGWTDSFLIVCSNGDVKRVERGE